MFLNFLKGSIMTNYTSIRDFAYQQAGTVDTQTNQARYAIDNFAGFPESIPDETKAELNEGYKLRYAENNPAVTYAVINGHYVKPTEEQLKSKKVEKVEIGVDYAFSFSSQEFGKLKNTNPALHQVVGAVRKAVSTYQSNTYGALVRKAKELLRVANPVTRQSLTFVESMTKIFTAQEKSCKVKQVRGSDTTANSVKYALAVKSFWDTYNK
jgi:hypothetical protein